VRREGVAKMPLKREDVNPGPDQADTDFSRVPLARDVSIGRTECSSTVNHTSRKGAVPDDLR